MSGSAEKALPWVLTMAIGAIANNDGTKDWDVISSHMS
jgi:hypothetical protein